MSRAYHHGTGGYDDAKRRNETQIPEISYV